MITCEDVFRRNRLGERKKKGQRFENLITFNKMIISGIIFLNKRIRKAVCVSPDHATQNRIDHIFIDKKIQKVMEDVQTNRETGTINWWLSR